jgi:hypothetical protein
MIYNVQSFKNLRFLSDQLRETKNRELSKTTKYLIQNDVFFKIRKTNQRSQVW